jgi:hypothetical protein
MSHRTQITLTDEQYERLRAESRETGLGLAEQVRRAVDRGGPRVQPQRNWIGLGGVPGPPRSGP